MAIQLYAVSAVTSTNLTTYTDVATAVTALGSTPATLVIMDVQSIVTNLVIPNTIRLRFIDAGQLSINGGVTLTVQGGIDGPTGVALFVGTGNVILSQAQLIDTNWFGNSGTVTYTRLQLIGPGTTTNDNAAAGIVGEYGTATIATGASISLSTTVGANVTSLSLTAGDWDVSGAVDYTFGATTNFTALRQGISTVSATLGGQDTFSVLALAGNVPTAAVDMALLTPIVRLSLNATTTIYLVTQCVFTVSTLKAYGTIRARRMR